MSSCEHDARVCALRGEAGCAVKRADRLLSMPNKEQNQFHYAILASGCSYRATISSATSCLFDSLAAGEQAQFADGCYCSPYRRLMLTSCLPKNDIWGTNLPGLRHDQLPSTTRGSS